MKARMATPGLTPEEQRLPGTRDIAIAAVFRANTYGAVGILPFTANGGTVRAMSEFYPETPIYAMTPFPETAQPLLPRGCTNPILIGVDPKSLKQYSADNLKTLARRRLFRAPPFGFLGTAIHLRG